MQVALSAVQSARPRERLDISGNSGFENSKAVEFARRVRYEVRDTGGTVGGGKEWVVRRNIEGLPGIGVEQVGRPLYFEAAVGHSRICDEQ